MAKYIAKRLGYALLTILVLLIITFLMMHAIPGDPITGPKATDPAIRAALEVKYGLDKSIPEQLLIYIMNAMKFDFGTSIKYGRPVMTIIMEAFPYSLDLGIRSLIIAVIAGMGLGAYAAIRRGHKGDTISMLIAVIGVSVPSFIVAALLNYFVALKLNQVLGFQIFPTTGWNSELSKVLPAIALSFGSLATISRLMRTSMLDVLSSDYIKTAKAKGLSERQIVFKHALRNASMPVLTVLGPIAASVLTGGFVVEQIFNIPGMGKFFVIAIQSQDYQLIAGTTLFYGAFLIISTLIVDILYGVIDPRVKLTNGKG